MRELYMTKLEMSVFKGLDQLRHMTEEIKILEHMEKVRSGEVQESEKEKRDRQELKVMHIPAGGFNHLHKYENEGAPSLCERHKIQEDFEK
mmetsp:Transcript_19255/g.13922  ORF Transcript_19255/g.13922 Transcript_19255/m.13922 type:complete len:91 (+) Transcript_19255:555-827(+)